MNRFNRIFGWITFLIIFCVFLATKGYSNDLTIDNETKNEKSASSENYKGDFIAGAQLWANNCSRCHRMRSPKDYKDELWKPVMYHMRIRGGFTGQETTDILEFLKMSN